MEIAKGRRYLPVCSFLAILGLQEKGFSAKIFSTVIWNGLGALFEVETKKLSIFVCSLGLC